MAGDQARCDQVRERLKKLKEGDSEEREKLLLWLHKGARQLSLSEHGCRVVQEAFDVGGPFEHALIMKEIADLPQHIVDLYESKYGNRVLEKAIQTLKPAYNEHFVLDKLRGERARIITKHRFGCRIMNRLIENCSPQEIEKFLDEVLVDPCELAKHEYGKHVIRDGVLEHVPSWRASIFAKLLPDLPALAEHRNGSLVVQKILECCEKGDKDRALSDSARRW